jgi:Ca2+-binding EF-hand superfamily protein
MIWENDENLDNYVDYSEFEKMYKRCIIDEREEEPKKLYYLVQFLMYDKEKKGVIIEEDTLEILYIRHGQLFEDAIVDIFS